VVGERGAIRPPTILLEDSTKRNVFFLPIAALAAAGDAAAGTSTIDLETQKEEGPGEEVRR
jgi:hypothetical protein